MSGSDGARGSAASPEATLPVRPTQSPRITVTDPQSQPAFSPLDEIGSIRPTVRSLQRAHRGSSARSSPRSSVHSHQGRVTANDWDVANAWKERVTDPWEACILSLDGGGIRGFSSALIIERLMREIHKVEVRLEKEDPIGYNVPANADDLLPCHYFDFMYGTSTGGLIAIMLSRLRMTMGECIKQYKFVGEQLFGHKKHILPFMTKYRCEPLEKAVQALVEDKGLGEWHPWAMNPTEDQSFDGAGDAEAGSRNDSVTSLEHESSDTMFNVKHPRVCQSCCLTAIHNGTVQEAHLLRSYDHFSQSSFDYWNTPYNDGADRLKIWQTCRATSAAPFYFDMLEAEVDGVMRGHKDGGLRQNNPSDAAYTEFVSMYYPKTTVPDRTIAPALLLSIGTGLTTNKPDGFGSTLPFPLGQFSWVRKLAENLSIIRLLLVKLTDSEVQHTSLRRLAHGENTWYKRLNVSTGMEGMPLDAWTRGVYRGEEVPGGATLAKMEDATLTYLEREVQEVDSFAAPKIKIQHSAEKLVRIRRARQKLGGERWEYFIGEGLKERMKGR